MTRPMAGLPAAIALLTMLGTAAAAEAEALVPLRTIPAQRVIGPADIGPGEIVVPGAITDPAAVIGMEARVALYPGRPILPGDLALPATIARNAILPLVYAAGNLLITTEGRALDRAGPGDVIRVMNLDSRTTVTARIGADGAAYVSQ
jgi:flagella basal body P-ring formation protein FlgA